MTSLKLFFVSLIATSILMFTNDSQSQTFKWEFGIEGGAGIRSLRFDPTDSASKTGIGFMGGIAVQTNLSPMWSIRLGAAYERRGADLETTVGTTTVEGRTNIDFISIPLLLRAYFGTGKKVRFFVNAGPNLGILLANKTKIDAFAGNPESEVDNKDSTKKIDFGITGGLGIDILVGTNMSFSVEARDNFGLTNINDSKITGAPEVKTNTANLVLGFSWKFGKKPIRR